jgi:hypothetical protein
MKKLSLFALLFAASTSSTLASADVIGGGSSSCDDRRWCKMQIVDDAGTCQQPDAAGTRCAGDAGTCAYPAEGCGPSNSLQCIGSHDQVAQPITASNSCNDGCSMSGGSFGESKVAVPTFLFGVAALAFLVDRRRRRQTGA